MDEYLFDVGLRCPRHATNRVRIHRHIAPSQDAEPFLAGNALQYSLADKALLRLHGKEDHSHTVFTDARQVESEFGAFALEESVRYLYQNAGAIAGLRIAAAGAPVG